MVSRNELSVWNTHTYCMSVCMPACSENYEYKLSVLNTVKNVPFTWIRCSSVAWSWLLDKTLISSCSGGLGRFKDAGQLSWAPVDNKVLGFDWENTLGDRSRVGATVAGIRWGEMTWRDRNKYKCSFAGLKVLCYRKRRRSLNLSLYN